MMVKLANFLLHFIAIIMEHRDEYGIRDGPDGA
jgi:hypothetical protein